MKATIALVALGLAKPSQKSKANGHQECLHRWLVLWKEGLLDTQLRGRRILEKYQVNSRKTDLSKANIFSILVMEGQITSALQYLIKEGHRGILPL